jgi:hypothetical protein
MGNAVRLEDFEEIQSRCTLNELRSRPRKIWGRASEGDSPTKMEDFQEGGPNHHHDLHSSRRMVLSDPRPISDEKIGPSPSLRAGASFLSEASESGKSDKDEIS